MTEDNASNNEKPKKYIKVHGVMKKNPDYKIWEEQQKSAAAATAGGSSGDGDGLIAVATTTDALSATTAANYCVVSVVAVASAADNNDAVVDSSDAIPIVSSIEEYKQMNDELGEDVPLADSVEATMEMLQDPDMIASITPSSEFGVEGGSSDDVTTKLCAVLTKYEIPIGMINKLMMLSEYHSLEFIIDDSTSMWEIVEDVIDPITHEPIQRWKEASYRLKEMLEILTYVPFQQIDIKFLNRTDHATLPRTEAKSPEEFLTLACTRIDALFETKPKGNTPILEKLQESFRDGKGKNIARYLFCDGQPNGGQEAMTKICTLLKTRTDPEYNPITFLSCTSDDAAVEWMKDAEEIIPYCSESDDFVSEAKEVYKDQGAAVPYTKGFHLICQLVAAMNPDDLDAMDESIPFTKFTLDNLLGVTLNEETYKHYFDCYLQAQQTRVYDMSSKMNQIRKAAVWSYDEFLTADGPGSKLVPAVEQMKRRLSGAKYFY